MKIKSSVSTPLYTRLLLPLLLTLMATVIGIVTSRQAQSHKAAHSAGPKNLRQFTSSGHILGFRADAVYVASCSHALHIEFVDANLEIPISDTPNDASSNNAQLAAPLSRVSYPNLWSGITLTYDAPERGILRSTYRVDPYANANDIALHYNAPVSVQSDGSLSVAFRSGTLNESKPRAWQERAGQRLPVQIAFASSGKGEIRFAIGDYDHTQVLFIDPTLTWNTFLGDSGQSIANGLAIDGNGNIDVVGLSSATWGTPVRPFSADFRAAFVAQLDANGNLKWNTFLGGSVGGPGCAGCPGDTQGQGIAVDTIGNIYAAGTSGSSWGSPLRPYTGGTDAFVAKLDSNGNLIWNTFLGGSAADTGNGITVDVIGNSYVTGQSGGTWGLPVRAYSGSNSNAFVAKLDLNGNLTWNTFFGGSTGDNAGNGLALDKIGNLYVIGSSIGGWGSPVRPYNTAGVGNAFVAKLLALTGNLIWNSFLGGEGGDLGFGIGLDASGNVYASGTSGATWGSPVRPQNSSPAPFVSRLDSNGNLVWNTFLGGNGDNALPLCRIVIDSGGNVDAVGASNVTWGSPDRPYTSGYDAFVAQVDANGNLVWNTFLGGTGHDEGTGVAIDSNGNIDVSGGSTATWGSPVHAFSSAANQNAFVAQLAAPTPTPTPTPSPTPTPTPSPSPTPTPTPTPTPAPGSTSTSAANFDGTAISKGNYIWFNSVLKPSGLGSHPVTFRFTQQTITSSNFTLSVPDATVTFDPVATLAATTFSGGMWVTRVPSSGLAGNTFLSALSYLVPANLPGGIKNVTWSGTFTSDTPGVTLQWQWGAAVYVKFSSDDNSLGVKPVDDNMASIYKNSDHAGTPEDFKSNVVNGVTVTGGATGGGGSNYTGGYSGTVNVGPF